MELKLQFDLECEARALSCCLNSLDAANAILADLRVTDFFSSNHVVIFQELVNLYTAGAKLSHALLVSSLEKSKSLDAAGGIAYISKISYYLGNDDNYSYYAKVLRNLANARSLVGIGKEMVELACQQRVDSESLMGEVQTRFYKLQGLDSPSLEEYSETMSTFSIHGSFKETMLWRIAQAKNALPAFLGFPCGYPILDELIGYFRPKAVYYVGARTSMGKTTFLLNLINNFLSKGFKVGFFSLEMPKAQINEKLTSIRAKVRFDQVEMGRVSDLQLSLLEQASDELSASKFYVDDQEGLTLSQVRARARRMLITYGIQILCIDYLTRIKPDGKHQNKHGGVDEVSKGLQDLAKELNMPIICLAQLNRGADDKEPALTHFRESGSIEEDADVCILLHRPDYKIPTEKPGVIEVFVAKNRARGMTKKVYFRKDSNSECYFEERYLKEEIDECMGRLT